MPKCSRVSNVEISTQVYTTTKNQTTTKYHILQYTPIVRKFDKEVGTRESTKSPESDLVLLVVLFSTPPSLRGKDKTPNARYTR